MGLVESFKRVFNISGAEITVNLDDEVLSQNDPVAGEVVIAGGKLDQSGSAITLELKERLFDTLHFVVQRFCAGDWDRAHHDEAQRQKANNKIERCCPSHLLCAPIL